LDATQFVEKKKFPIFQILNRLGLFEYRYVVSTAASGFACWQVEILNCNVSFSAL